MSEDRRYQAEILVKWFVALPSGAIAVAEWLRTKQLGWIQACCLVVSLLGILVSLILRRKSTRFVCPSCKADIETAFMAPATPGKDTICKACSGDANRYPWFTRRLWKRGQPIDVFTAKAVDQVVENRMCSRCLRVKYLPFLVEVPNPEGGYRKFECLPRDRKACDRRARIMSIPLEQRRWHLLRLRSMRFLRGLSSRPRPKRLNCGTQ